MRKFRYQEHAQVWVDQLTWRQLVDELLAADVVNFMDLSYWRGEVARGLTTEESMQSYFRFVLRDHIWETQNLEPCDLPPHAMTWDVFTSDP